jgi:hypothetical protein
MMCWISRLPVRSRARSLGLVTLFVAAAGLAAPVSAATRGPCSGKKGGVDHCDNGKFVCKDGSRSASKKICEKTG